MYLNPSKMVDSFVTVDENYEKFDFFSPQRTVGFDHDEIETNYPSE